MLRKRHSLLTRPAAYAVMPLPTVPHDDLQTMTADELRDHVQQAFSVLAEADRKTWLRRLYVRMKRARVHTNAALFMLGIMAERFEELTPCDLGKLLRYLRINQPAAIKALAAPLSELLVVKPTPVLTPHGGREAA